ncbi:hypothetical protein JQ600_02570 [Bradyrhizobium sp. AUGA SZCCT0176]|uniref:hypothetical protein n=1 Tax=Bradyrhizobium sp. AUGA SZCCT0176 TaxID=2807664 RepID=UPI001BA9C63D|nr:hypothetical protein [Bradyrhizobium sp. AUGA SZCCT0176]MBR1223782.1 hypothetical protein [Bradyrhizobium sp. AUGA SZCCT0176]
MAAPKYGDLVKGEEYLTVICPNEVCKNVIPIAPAGVVHTPKVDRAITIGCPFCGKSADHFPRDAGIRPLDILPPTAQ